MANALANYIGDLPTVVPDATGTPSTDYTNLQTLIGAGGMIIANFEGTYMISQPLIIPSFTYLLLGPATTIKLANQSNTNMLVNANATSTVWAITSISAAAPSGTFQNTQSVVTVTTTLTHNIKAGGFVLIKGDTTGIYNGIWYVTAVTTNTFKFFYMALAANLGTGGGSMTAAQADGQILIEGGVWDGNGLNQSGIGSNYYKGMPWYLNKVYGVRARDLTLRNGFGQYIFAQAYDCLAVNVDIQGSNGLQAIGPCRHIIFEKIESNCADDVVSCLPVPGPGFSGNNLPNGDINGGDVRDVTFRDVTSYSNQGASICSIYQGNVGTAFAVTDIKVQNIASVVGALNAVGVAIRADGATTTEAFGRIQISNVTGNFASAAVQLLGTNGQTTTYDQIEVLGVYGDPSIASPHGAIDIQFATYKQLIVEKIKLFFDQTAGSRYAVNMSNSGCSGENTIIDDFYVTSNGTTNGCGVFQSANAGNTVGRVIGENGTYSGSVAFMNSPAFTGAASVVLDNIRCNGGLSLISLGSSSANIHAANCQSVSASQAAFNLFGSSGTVNVWIDGLEATGNITLNFGSGNTINWYNPDGTAPVDITKLSRSNGQAARHNGATTAGTIGTHQLNCTCDDTNASNSWSSVRAGAIVSY
jgi:hypothetical protein